MLDTSSQKVIVASPAKGLFLGELRSEGLLPFPQISTGEQETLRLVLESIDRFMADKGEDFRAYDVKGEQPESYLDELRNLGLFSLIIPEQFGGLGFSNSAYSRVLQQTSRYDASTSLTIGAHSSIGMKALLLFGTPEQKERYLPRLATGEVIAAFCLTEAGSGSDAASVKTFATKNSDGTWTLNGEKIWITNGGTAGFFTVFAKTETDGGKMTGFIVERGWEGVSTGPKEDKMGIRASCTTTVRFDNVKVPADCVLGEEGKGFKVAMAVLNNGRTGLGGGCVGAMKRLIELSIAQATQRKQFGKSISEFQLIKEKIAAMTTLCFASESIVSVVGSLIDSGAEDFSVEAAMSKIFVSEALWTVADEALQIAGGNGFMREFPYERVVRDCRINRIFEGTNEILRLYVGLSGIKEPGEALADVAKGVKGIFNDPIKGFGILTEYASRKVGQLTPIGRSRLQGISSALEDETFVLEQGVAKLAQAVEAALSRYRKGIIEQQLATKRLADVATDLFVGMCVLSRVTSIIAQKGEPNCKDELRIARIFTQMARVRISNNLKALVKNSDSEILSLADSVLAKGSYSWDVL
jgi:alkylation response protein AidB-like acyl-CoA dehydrogenase